MTAIGELQQFRIGEHCLNALDLRHCTVFVAITLDCQHRTGNLRNDVRYVPFPKSGIEPNVVPAVKGGFDVVVVAGKPSPKIGFEERLPDLVNTGHRYRLDHDMWGHHDKTCHQILEAGRMDQGDRAPVAMPEQPWPI